MVFHNAAIVNSTKTYEELKESNVIGTLRILKFCQESGSVLQHISTIGLLAGSGINIESGSVPSNALSYLSGYAQSKWMAERLVLRAFENGLTGNIFRPGTLVGDTTSGICNPQDSFTLILTAIIKDKLICVSEDSPLPNLFLLVPVDWAASAVITIAFETLKANMKADVYHIVSSCPLSLTNLEDWLEDWGIEAVDSETYKSTISLIDEDHPLFVFKSVLSGKGYASASVDNIPKDNNTRKYFPKGSPPIDKHHVRMMATIISTQE
eukprot:TRINITY_DN10405_c0_g1_i1.p1 TRINITY_DN10405_c0_g1~~TRINITY_DN10405_c0_g1_i1.p1  ORF type:complete len:267 (-),score=41.75 TRINITY_DN10405_c0_g1_i1:90-890(-)